jgi:hypothetical protein
MGPSASVAVSASTQMRKKCWRRQKGAIKGCRLRAGGVMYLRQAGQTMLTCGAEGGGALPRAEGVQR